MFAVRDVMFVVWRRLVLPGHIHPILGSWSIRHDVMSFITSQFPLLCRYAANLSPHARVTCKCSGIIWQNMSWSGCQRKLITSKGELSSIETVPMATTLFFYVMLNRLMRLGPLGPLPGGRNSGVVVPLCTTWNQKLKKINQIHLYGQKTWVFKHSQCKSVQSQFYQAAFLTWQMFFAVFQ